MERDATLVMRKTTFITAIIAAAALATIGMSGCQSEPKTIARGNTGNTSQDAGAEKKAIDGVAATVDGVEITEQEVADFVTQYRLYANVEEDSAWATLLDESSLTPQMVRESAIRQVAGTKLLEKKANELGISVTDEELDEIITQHRKTADAVDDATWKALLDTTGYTEESYREDIRKNVLSDRITEKEMTEIETPSEATLQDFAREYPEYYTGKKTISVIYSSGNTSQAASFKNKFEGKVTEKEFRDAAAKDVEDKNAREVKDEGWSCLSSSISSYELDAIKDAHAGDTVRYSEPDGSHCVVFIAEEYSTDLNGYPILKNMPSDIRARLEDDCKASTRTTAIQNYVTDLLDKAKITINDMPQGLPYDVDMKLSNYGSETTREEDEAAAQKLVDEHINELSISGTDSNGNIVSEALNGSK